MISIDTAQHGHAPGYVELPNDLFDALANIAKANPDAEGIRAGAEHYDASRKAVVWHVFADTPRGDFRYVITDAGALIGIETHEGEGDGEWSHIDLMTGIDPFTCEVQS